ncbi:MAG: hypothetical protein KBA33_06190 [Cloacibacterium sp.]|nr:hypothetical protein [Cloacibacterium sp.]
MKINNIKILDHKTCLEIENNNYSEEIMKEFISRNGFNVDDIFDFRDKVYLTKEISLNVENGDCNIIVYAEFVAFQKDIKS